MAAHHYLGYRRLVGNTIRYVAELDGEWIALLGWAAAVLQCGARERWIGWSDEQRLRRLRFVVNNRRFLMHPERPIPNAASKILAANVRRLSSDWESLFGHRVVLAETFIDEGRFAGTCYRAAGWLRLGETLGYGRRSGRHYYHGQRRGIWVRSLDRRVCQWLSASFDTPGLVGGPCCGMVDLNKLTINGEGGLLDRLDRLPDVRKQPGKRHSLRSILAVGVCGALMGGRSFRELGEWAAKQPQEVLGRLDCRFHPEKRRYLAPSEPTLRRMLNQVDVDRLDQVVHEWLEEQEGPAAAVVQAKTPRGCRNDTPKAFDLVAVLVRGQGGGVRRRKIPVRTNETTRTCVDQDPQGLAGRRD